MEVELLKEKWVNEFCKSIAMFISPSEVAKKIEAENKYYEYKNLSEMFGVEINNEHDKELLLSGKLNRKEFK